MYVSKFQAWYTFQAETFACVMIALGPVRIDAELVAVTGLAFGAGIAPKVFLALVASTTAKFGPKQTYIAGDGKTNWLVNSRS